MIGRLRGQLLLKRPPALLVEAGGVGYELEAPMSTFYNLPAVGDEIVLHTHLLVREDAHILYGFTTENDRALFRALLKVNGVGARMALAILSGMDAATFTHTIQIGDAARLTRLPGIGKKTAERLIIEMCDRLSALPTGSSLDKASRVNVSPAALAEDEAAQALIALGYKPQEAGRMVAGVVQPGMSAEGMIRQALRMAVK